MNHSADLQQGEKTRLESVVASITLQQRFPSSKKMVEGHHPSMT